MDPEIFDTWCNILKRVPNSALWLLRFPAAGETRVRSHAAARGVRPDQIVFTDVAMKNEHIRRSQLADLFLDTPLCNAHTTGTDILWAGLPMITLPLEKMATRVAGSLCVATGLGEEMIVSSMKEYEERAVELALNPAKLQALTNKLKEVRMSCPLFDTARWVSSPKECPSTFHLGDKSGILTKVLHAIVQNGLRCATLKGLTTRCGTCTALVATRSHSRWKRMTMSSCLTANEITSPAPAL
jgi:hypothetical protein